MPLSERQKAMLLKDTSGVVQQSSRASDTTFGKLAKASTPFVSDFVVSERILLVQPLPTSQPIPIISQIFEPILLPPPLKTPIKEPITGTPQVFYTSSQQRNQQKPLIHSSP